MINIYYINDLKVIHTHGPQDNVVSPHFLFLRWDTFSLLTAAEHKQFIKYLASCMKGSPKNSVIIYSPSCCFLHIHTCMHISNICMYINLCKCKMHLFSGHFNLSLCENHCVCVSWYQLKQMD